MGGMDHRQARRMDRLRLASATRTNHLPQRNGSLPNHRRWQSHRKCVETLVRKQGPITTDVSRESELELQLSQNERLRLWAPARAALGRGDSELLRRHLPWRGRRVGEIGYKL